MSERTSLDADAIRALIEAFLAREFFDADESALGPDDNIFASGSIDSIGVIRLVDHLQATLGVTVPPPDLVPNNFRTPRIMAEYLRTLLDG